MTLGRIIVMGYIVRGPLGGLSWHHLHYVLGLARMGYDVLYVEDSGDGPSCYDPTTDEIGSDPTFGLAFIEDAFARVGLGERWAYYDAFKHAWQGPAAASGEPPLHADVVLNVSGVNPLRDWAQQCPIRVFIDTDPAFTQVRSLTEDAAHDLIGQHNAHFTFAELVHDPASSVPDDGTAWAPTRQPLVLDAWPARPPIPQGSWTTVMQWESYPSVEWQGRSFGTKSSSFLDYITLPELVAENFELALGGGSAPRDQLTSRGWSLANPLEVTRTPWTYQDYLAGSKGEFTVAKEAYVSTRSGWFSERSANYLASGRPVVTQDTGFSSLLPTGEGLFAFADLDSAAEAIGRVTTDYEHHCAAARQVAEEHFGHAKVLGHLLNSIT